MKNIFLILVLSTTFIACEKYQAKNLPAAHDPCDIISGLCEITGMIQKQGVTSYQYGTHVISGHALRSNLVILEDFINRDVTIIGYKIDGYPLDGGPVYIEVTDIVCDVMD